MAVYRKLLLSAGGGIISTKQQADQAENTATLLIGLGGTGISCIRTIKTQVRARLKPDDPDAVVKTYEHIRFLGVDADEKSIGFSEESEDAAADSLLALDNTEFFSIANKNIKSALRNERVLDSRTEIKWLRWRDIPIPDFSDAGAGGVRQIGRLMLMDKSTEFLAKVESEINAAKSGLTNPQVNVHIFTGISGGTGAGVFLDVCYMVRSIANRLGGVTMLGYFFLPDVNLDPDRIPMSKTRTRAYVPVNGYASMQELDYCMQLQHNGGSFVQEYQGHTKIAWREAPVDLAHLICATDSTNRVIPHAYDYAMSVTSEYVLDFLTKPLNSQFGLSSQLANFRNEVANADGDKTIGVNLSYCVIGASCASLPYRQINTYLASELFNKFSSIGGNTPGQRDVEELVVRALVKYGGSFQQAYDSLGTEITEDAGADFAPYLDDWKYVKRYGNDEMVRHYTDQKAAKLGDVEKNARSMLDKGNGSSLMGRLRKALEDVIRDLDRGPVFAHGMLQAATSHNLINVIEGLITQNQERWGQEAAQSELRQRDYDEAKREFDQKAGGFLVNSNKLFERYKFYLEALVRHQLMMETYEQLDGVLRVFRGQIEETAGSYYAKLARVTQNLIETFQANREALKSDDVLVGDDSFTMPLMSVQELQKPMEAEIKGINVPSMLNKFMSLMLSHEEDWKKEDENEITKLVTSFFVDDAFSGFAGRSITEFLKDKYDTSDNSVLANYVYKEWMRVLTDKARPLFNFDESIWPESKTSRLAYLSVPSISAPIVAAAQKINRENSMWQVKASALTDRIFIMGSAAALPMAAYSNVVHYQASSYATVGYGRHYYETPGLAGMTFSDWRKLSPLMPFQYLDTSMLPEDVSERISEASRLFDEACKAGIITKENDLLQLDASYIDAVNEACEKVRALVRVLDAPDKIDNNVQVLKDSLAELTDLKLVRSGHGLKLDGFQETEEQRKAIAKDYFIAAPAYQIEVRETLKRMGELKSSLAAASELLETQVEKVVRGANDLLDFCDALFSGVITIEGPQVKYEEDSYGIKTEHLLSSRMDDKKYPFRDIPIYQAFLSYQALDASLQDKIREAAAQRLTEGSDELIAVGNKLKQTLSAEKANGWAQRAAMKAERVEILDFITKVRSLLQTHLLDWGI